MIKTYTLIANDYELAGTISSDIKKYIKSIETDSALIKRVSIACYEAEINMIIHSKGGNISLNVDSDWINLNFTDSGPGIMDIDLAMKPGFSTADVVAQSMGFGAGLGLCNIEKNSDTFSIHSSPQGTNLKIAFKRKGDNL
ncbi:MAG: ATP-binding protein [Erysipelotrichaceae bacterium]